MSTDELLDARLQEAGLRWRLENTAIATVDLLAATATAAEFDAATEASTEVPLVHSTSKNSRRGRRIWLTSAAGIAAAIAAILIATQLSDDSHSKPRPLTANRATLVGTEWQLTALRAADGSAIQRARYAGLTLDENGSLTFDDGCTSSAGHAVVQNGSLEIAALTRRASACPAVPGDSQPESQLIARVLSGSVRWSVAGEVLTLTKAGAGSLVYRPYRATRITEPKALLGVGWHLHTVASDGTVSSTDGFGDVTLRFDGRGQVASSDGCFITNRHVTLKAGGADFGRAGPGSACAGMMRPSPPAPPIVDKVLDGSVTWYLSGQFLTITKSGVGSLVYEMSSPAPTR